MEHTVTIRDLYLNNLTYEYFVPTQYIICCIGIMPEYYDFVALKGGE